MKTTVAVAALCMGMLVAGCRAPSSRWVEVKSSPSRHKIKLTVDSDRSVQITHVSVLWEDDSLRLTGVLRPRFSWKTSSTGHVDVFLKDRKGHAVGAVKAKPSVGMFFRSSLIKPHFDLLIAVQEVDIKEVHLKSHHTAFEACDLAGG